MEFLIFLLWVILSVLVGMKADMRGRSGIGFALLSIVTSPLLGFIIVLCTVDLAEQARRDGLRRIEDERHLATIRALTQKHN